MNEIGLINQEPMPQFTGWVIDSLHVTNFPTLKGNYFIDTAGVMFEIPDACLIASIEEYRFMPPKDKLEQSERAEFLTLTEDYCGFLKGTLIHVKSSKENGLIYITPFPI